MNRLAELRTHREDPTRLLDVGALPLRVVDTGCSHDEILDRGTCVRLLRHHDAAGEQETIEGHRLYAILLGPVTREVGPCIV